MGLYKYPLKHLDEAQITGLARGKVEEFLDMILRIPEFGRISGSEDAIIDRLDKLDEYAQELIHALSSADVFDIELTGSIANPAASYSTDLEEGYANGSLDKLNALLQQIDRKACNKMQEYKLNMIEYALYPDMDGFKLLREEIKAFKDWILTW
jgi:hypothetical protein